MTGIVPLFKILCVPLFVALMTQVMCLVIHGLNPRETSGTSMLTNGDLARVAFINQAATILVLTILIGMPLFRYWTARGQLGFKQWLSGWILVHIPFVLLEYMKPMVLTDRILGALAMGGSLLVVASIWWMLFYSEKSQDELTVIS